MTKEQAVRASNRHKNEYSKGVVAKKGKQGLSSIARALEMDIEV